MSVSPVTVELSVEDQEFVELFARRLAELNSAIQKRKLYDPVLTRKRTIIHFEDEK